METDGEIEVQLSAPLPTDRLIRKRKFLSRLSFASLVGFFGCGYLTYLLYETAGTDTEKYAAITASFGLAILCWWSTYKGITSVGLGFWALRSSKTTILASVLQGLAGTIYALALTYPDAKISTYLLQAPVICSTLTVIAVIYLFILFRNLVQLPFPLGCTVTIVDVLLSIGLAALSAGLLLVALLYLLYILLGGSSSRDAPARAQRSYSRQADYPEGWRKNQGRRQGEWEESRQIENLRKLQLEKEGREERRRALERLKEGSRGIIKEWRKEEERIKQKNPFTPFKPWKGP